MEVGQVVMKVTGREAGRLAVVLKKTDGKFVSVTGPKLLTGVKRRKANIMHLEPTQHRLEIREDAPDEEVIGAFKKSGLSGKLGLMFPSAAEIKSQKAKEESLKTKEPKEAKAKKAKESKAEK